MPDDRLDDLPDASDPAQTVDWMQKTAAKSERLATSGRRFAYAAMVVSIISIAFTIATNVTRVQQGQRLALPLLLSVFFLAVILAVIAFSTGFLVGVRRAFVRRRSAP